MIYFSPDVHKTFLSSPVSVKYEQFIVSNMVYVFNAMKLLNYKNGPCNNKTTEAAHKSYFKPTKITPSVTPTGELWEFFKQILQDIGGALNKQ